MKILPLTKALLMTFIANGTLIAGEADVEHVEIKALGQGSFRVDVTLRHEDSGWDHYANRWDILDETGKVIGTRVLYHPHVNEQPFTRSLTLQIPDSVKIVTIEAHDLVHMSGGKTFDAEVPHR